MPDRLNKAHFIGQPTISQSGPARTSNNVFAGVATINSGSSTVTLTGLDIRSESLVFLGAQHFSTSTISGAAKALGVCSMTVATVSNSGAAGFMVSTVDSAACATSVRVPYMVFRLQ